MGGWIERLMDKFVNGLMNVLVHLQIDSDKQIKINGWMDK